MVDRHVYGFFKAVEVQNRHIILFQELYYFPKAKFPFVFIGSARDFFQVISFYGKVVDFFCETTGNHSGMECRVGSGFPGDIFYQRLKVNFV